MRSQFTNVKLAWWNWLIHKLPRKWLRTHPTVSLPYAKTTSPGVNVVLELFDDKAGGHRYITATALDRGVFFFGGYTRNISEYHRFVCWIERSSNWGVLLSLFKRGWPNVDPRQRTYHEGAWNFHSGMYLPALSPPPLLLNNSLLYSVQQARVQ